MTDFTLSVGVDDEHVATIGYRRGEHNYFSRPLIGAIADALDGLAADGHTRAVVLTGEGRHFCAGADFTRGAELSRATGADGGHIYEEAVRLFRQPLPVVAAVQGAAIGGGLGLAMAFDFRVAEPGTTFAGPFSRLGLHHGFGLSVTLPLAAGHQNALDLLYTGRRVKGEEALRLGLCDRLAPEGGARTAARAFAAEIAAAAPIAVRSIRRTLRGHLADAVLAATAHERTEQDAHQRTADFAEGVAADLERRTPRFAGA